MRWLGLVLVVLAAGCGGDGERRTVTVAMEEQAGSTQFGDAVLTDVGDSEIRVDLSVGSAGRTQYARVLRGSCGDLGRDPAYILSNVVEGESTTELDVGLEELVESGYAVAVYQSPELLHVAVCGEIRS